MNICAVDDLGRSGWLHARCDCEQTSTNLTVALRVTVELRRLNAFRMRNPPQFYRQWHAGLIRIAFELNVANLEKIFTKH
jgi:hypothetical protein